MLSEASPREQCREMDKHRLSLGASEWGGEGPQTSVLLFLPYSVPPGDHSCILAGRAGREDRVSVGRGLPVFHTEETDEVPEEGKG